MTRVQTCETCDGIGRVSEPFCNCAWNCGGRYCGTDEMPCPDCNGRGMVTMEDDMTLQHEGDEHAERPLVERDLWVTLFGDAIRSGMGLSEARDHADKRAAETEREER